jgi:ribosomal protein S18 acetylase RimI-like enzyme
MNGVTIRRAVFADLQAIVAIYAADDKGGHGDGWSEASRPAYEAAMRAVLMSPTNRLFVAVLDEAVIDTGRGLKGEGGRIVGTFQLTIIPGLVGGGRTRAKVESVHVARDMRGRRIGEAMMSRAVEEARSAGARIMELSSNKKRTDAHRFYERLGFSKSHEGFKLSL